MQANNRDAGSLWDMLNAIGLIQEFTANLTYDAYLESVLVQSAVERQLGILGEAARRLSDEFRQAHPGIDWRRVIGLRNILIHRYDEVQTTNDLVSRYLRAKSSTDSARSIVTPIARSAMSV